MNPALRLAFAAICLFLLLTSLLLGGVNTDEAGFRRMSIELDKYSRAEDSLQRDVLLVRAGLLRDYDPLVADSANISDSVSLLRQDVRTQGLDPAPADALATAARMQADDTEIFKSKQAQLRNSLAYFPILAAQASAVDNDPRAIVAVEALRDSVLGLVLDTSSNAAEATDAKLRALEGVTLPPGPAADIQLMLLRHGHMLQYLLPVVDGVLHDLVSQPTLRLRSAVQAQIDTRHMTLQKRAWDYRIALYAVAIMLLFLIVRFWFHLRTNRLALEDRAAIERMVADISTRLVACSPEQTGIYLDEVLAAMGAAIAVDRVYVLIPEPFRVHLWCREPEASARDWPAQALEVAQQAPLKDGVFHIAATRRLPLNQSRHWLNAARVRSWAGVPLAPDLPTSGLVGFDMIRSHTRWPRCGVEVLRAVAPIIEGALTRERAAAERDMLQARLRQAQRLETAGTLASGLAHNFNNIIGAVLGHAEMAAETTTRHAATGGHIEEIRRAGERAKQLVDDMLTFARGDIARSPVSVSDLVAESASLLRVSLPPLVTLTVQDAAMSATVIGAPAQLQQVIVNLVRNAAQAMGENGGQIQLRLAQFAVLESRPLSLGTIVAGDYVRLSVSDTGRGMDEATRWRIFDAFFTTKSAGTGLGLATVADILRDHGGAIDVRSAPGQGSVFEAWLPQGREAPPSVNIRLGQGEVVMVVDDDTAQRMRMEDMLAALGYEPIGFDGCAAATMALRQSSGSFDVALLRASEPHSESLRLAERLISLDARLRIVLIGDDAAAAGLSRSLGATTTELVAEPATSSKLAAALARSLHGAFDMSRPR